MQHTIPLEQLVESIGPQAQAMAHAVEACVHCGFCLPTCPTYQVMGEEMDSPRGRILLMKSVLEGDLGIEETAPYIDRCLGCLACVSVCPSGVKYEELITPYRAYAEKRRSRSLSERTRRRLVRETLPNPKRFRTAVSAGRWSTPLKTLLPQSFQSMLALLPEQLPDDKPLPEVYPAKGKRRARVALLAGCVQQALDPEINWATLRVLAENGVETIIPKEQNCCGALMMHTGQEEEARQLASRNMHVFPKDVDAILTNAAGCGSGMKEYGWLFRGLPDEAQAVEFSQLVQDIATFLDALGIQPPALPEPLRVAYHDACHLSHAQGITEAPRRLLSAIPNLTLVDIPDGEICCGSAGTYNLDQPVIASALGQRKVENILGTQAQAVATGNIGCMVQVSNHLKQASQPIPVYHTIEILDMAYKNGR
ncbi:MAG: glycolate oxidase subunit GlcF [Anaerolineales bacterium]|jgi:glycolate oxidase iron-sulfur subunit